MDEMIEQAIVINFQYKQKMEIYILGGVSNYLTSFAKTFLYL